MTNEDAISPQLLSSWTWTTIESIAKTEKGSIRMGPFGSQLKKTELVEKGIRVLWIENIVNNKFEYKEGKFITEEKYRELKGFAVTPGELLITMMGTIGRTAIVPNDIGKAIISSHLLRIRLDSQLCDTKYLKYFLLSENSKKQMNKESRGVVMKGLNTKIIKSLTIPLPPFSEQRRIVLKVEELFSFLDAGAESLHKVQAQLKRYRQVVLKYAFEGKLTEEWRKTHKESTQRLLELPCYAKSHFVLKCLLNLQQLFVTFLAKSILTKAEFDREEWEFNLEKMGIQDIREKTDAAEITHYQ